MQTRLFIDGELTDGLAGRSGYGREMGFAAMEEYTTRKSVWINVDAPVPDWYAP